MYFCKKQFWVKNPFGYLSTLYKVSIQVQIRMLSYIESKGLVICYCCSSL
jgi:hypothetical protein